MLLLKRELLLLFECIVLKFFPAQYRDKTTSLELGCLKSFVCPLISKISEVAEHVTKGKQCWGKLLLLAWYLSIRQISKADSFFSTLSDEV